MMAQIRFQFWCILMTVKEILGGELALFCIAITFNVTGVDAMLEYIVHL